MTSLSLTVRFLEGRYHAASEEWPPGPARLFLALVHGGKTGAAAKSWTKAHDDALEWLSGLEPPEIFCRRATRGRRYLLFVPNNSLGKDYRNTRTAKLAAPRILERHTVGKPDVIYHWRTQDIKAAKAHVTALDQLSGRLLALGWGVDLAFAAAELNGELIPSTLDMERFVSAKSGGRAYRGLRRGLLRHLMECHRSSLGRITSRGVNPFTRPKEFPLIRYRNAVDLGPRRWISFGLETPDGEPFGARWDQTPIVAAWLRHMAGEALQEELRSGPHEPLSSIDQAWLDSYILGHTNVTQKGHRLSYIPIPTVGHRHSDGGVRRVLLVEPPTAESTDARGLDLLEIKAPTRLLKEEPNGKPRAVLTPLEDRSRVLPFYVDRGRIWRSVTPVVLHGHNTVHRRISISKTERLLYQAFDAAHYPVELIRNICFQTAPYWSGCEASGDMPVPSHLRAWPRVHVYVEFGQAVDGPIAIGLGRHYGIGVFARMPD